MVGVRIRRKAEDALFELSKLGPVRCLRDNVFLLSRKQCEALKALKIPFEPVEADEIREKMRGVILV
jgi:hypothetical protein